MIYLKQSNPKWASITLGKSKASLAAYGCAVTSISMLTDYFKGFIDPGKLAKKLNFTSDGSLLWESVTASTVVHFLWRYYAYDEKVALEAAKNPLKAILFRVWFKHANGTKTPHWVVAVKKIPFTKTWVIVDPITGALSSTLKYGNEISGMATFGKK